MILTLYKNNSEFNRIEKSLTVVDTLQCEINADCSVTNPVFVITNKNLDFNYCHADGIFNRYYYVENIEVLRGGKLALHCRVDVLKSFAQDIRQADVIAERSTSDYNRYIPDTAYDFTSAEKRFSYARLPFEFDTSETGAKHYIITIGGAN